MDNNNRNTTGIRVIGGGQHTIKGNAISGHETGVHLENTMGNTVEDNQILAAPLSDDAVEKIKSIITQQPLAEPIQKSAHMMADQLKEERDPSVRQQIWGGLKSLVGPVVSGLLVEALKGTAGLG